MYNSRQIKLRWKWCGYTFESVWVDWISILGCWRDELAVALTVMLWPEIHSL